MGYSEMLLFFLLEPFGKLGEICVYTSKHHRTDTSRHAGEGEPVTKFPRSGITTNAPQSSDELHDLEGYLRISVPVHLPIACWLVH